MPDIFKQLFLLCSCLLYTNVCTSNESHLIINGKAVHSRDPPNQSFNEKNLGLGLQYDFTQFDRKLIPFLNIGGFSDSNYNPSYYFGGGITHRSRFRNNMKGFHLDAGIFVFIMSREKNAASRGSDNNIYSGALPMLSVGTDSIALNLSYIPKTDVTGVSLWFFQLKFRLSGF